MSGILAVRGSPPPEQVLFEGDEYGLLPGEENLDATQWAPAQPRESLWQRCWKPLSTIGAFGGAAASVAVRVLGLSRWTNVIGSVGAGYFTQAVISSRFSGDSLARVRRICLTLFGQMTLFALTQICVNRKDDHGNLLVDQTNQMLVHLIIAELGANAEILLQRLWEEGGIRVESHAQALVPGEKFKHLSILRSLASGALRKCGLDRWSSAHLIPPMVPYILKLGASGACAVLVSLKEEGQDYVEDPVARGLISFGASIYGLQVAGGIFLIWVDHQIKKHDSDESTHSLTERGGTWYRKLKYIFTTLAYLAIPLSFVPWTAKPDTMARLGQLVVVGGVLGFFDEIRNAAIMARMKIPPASLSEFKSIETRSEPTSPRSTWERVRHGAYRIWGVATPILISSGLIWFVAKQTCCVLNDKNSKIALGTMLGSFLGTFGLCKVADWTWDPDRRGLLRDKLMGFLFASPRVFGINPLFIYLAGVNALAMNNHSIEAQENKFHLATIIVSWGAQGFSAARELWITMDTRVGSALIDAPWLVLGNAVLTTKLYITGDLL